MHEVDHARLADSTLGASFLLTHDRGRSKPSLRPRARPDEKETPPKALWCRDATREIGRAGLTASETSEV
jgi:hypothetical protein